VLVGVGWCCCLFLFFVVVVCLFLLFVVVVSSCSLLLWSWLLFVVLLVCSKALSRVVHQYHSILYVWLTKYSVVYYQFVRAGVGGARGSRYMRQ
jgi:hypothetical protein